MTFPERYKSEHTWHARAMVMEIFHLAAVHNDNTWTIARTASTFECSLGLVSENLKLALALHQHPILFNCQTRQEALTKLRSIHV